MLNHQQLDITNRNYLTLAKDAVSSVSSTITATPNPNVPTKMTLDDQFEQEETLLESYGIMQHIQDMNVMVERIGYALLQNVQTIIVGLRSINKNCANILTKQCSIYEELLTLMGTMMMLTSIQATIREFKAILSEIRQAVHTAVRILRRIEDRL